MKAADRLALADRVGLLVVGAGGPLYLLVALLSPPESYSMLGVIQGVLCCVPFGSLICLLCLLASKDPWIKRASVLLLLINAGAVLLAFLRGYP